MGFATNVSVRSALPGTFGDCVAVIAHYRGLPPNLDFDGPRTHAQITLGFHYTIRPSSFSNCTDGDGTSLSLLGGVVRTEVGIYTTNVRVTGPAPTV